jgi:hypothetical protein
MIPARHAPCKCGAGEKTLTGGGSAQRSTWTSAVAELGPWLSREVPRSRVSTFALPCEQGALSASLAGSYQAPQDSRTTPGRRASVTTTPAKHAPRLLNTRTTSPSPMPRSRAARLPRVPHSISPDQAWCGRLAERTAVGVRDHDLTASELHDGLARLRHSGPFASLTFAVQVREKDAMPLSCPSDAAQCLFGSNSQRGHNPDQRRSLI